MNRLIGAGLGTAGAMALALAPLTATAGEHDDDDGYGYYPPKPYVEIVDSYAKTVDKKIVTKYVNKHGKVVKVVVKEEYSSKAKVTVDYKCFSKNKHYPKDGEIKAYLQDWHGSAKAKCDGEKHTAYIDLYGHSRLEPGYSWLTVKLTDPQYKTAYDKEKVHVKHEKVVKYVVKHVGKKADSKY
jgi:hypothetical protein